MLKFAASLHQFSKSVAPEHAVDKVSQWSPEIFPTRKVVLIDEQDVVLETCIQVSLQAQFADDWVVVAVDMSVYTIHALENLSDHAGKRLREGNA